MRRKTTAVLVGVIAFAAFIAAAATLGGLRTKSLGADVSVVAACDTDGIDVDYTTAYDPASHAYQVTAVQLGDIDPACDGLGFKVTLADGTASLSEDTGTVAQSAGNQTVTLAAPVDAESIAEIAVVIAG